MCQRLEVRSELVARARLTEFQAVLNFDELNNSKFDLVIALDVIDDKAIA